MSKSLCECGHPESGHYAEGTVDGGKCQHAIHARVVEPCPCERFISATSSLFEFRIEQDKNLLGGEDLARITYRRTGTRRWSKVLVVLDDETTYETVEANAEHLILLHEGSQSRVRS